MVISFFFGAMTIVIIGIPYISSNEERLESVISQSINPFSAYKVMIEHLEYQKTKKLSLIQETQMNRKKLLEKSNKIETKQIYGLIIKETQLTEDYISISKKVKSINKFYEENKHRYQSKEEFTEDYSKCHEEMKLRYKLYESDRNIGSYFLLGFILVFLGGSIIFLTYFGTSPPNAPIWVSFILFPLGITLWVYGNRYRKETLDNSSRLKEILTSRIQDVLSNG